MKLRTDAQWLIGRPIAHRGMHDLANGIPENSLPAFEKATKNDFPVELDVQLTKDDRMIVLHDEDLSRLTGKAGAVRSTSYESIYDLRLGDTAERIPLFSEALEVIDGSVPVIVEIKNVGEVGKLEGLVLKALRSYEGPVAVVSFNPLSLKYFFQNAPEFLRGQNSGLFRRVDMNGAQLNLVSKLALRLMVLNGLSHPDFVSYQYEGIRTFPVAIRRSLGLPVLTWTVRTADDAKRARKFADNFFFENFIPES